MTQPSRPSPATEGTVTESQGPPDQTVPRADTLAAEAPPANSDAPNFAPPEHAGEVGKLGRYRVLKELGRGGMGAVYLGYDSALDRKVALKVMLPNHAANRDARERFLREARTAAMVKSDHVVTIFDVAEERGIPFIAMQYLLGYPLDQYLKTKGELPLVHVLRVGRETALGLAAAHELGLIHRDIKPANLWLEAPKGRVKLLDFGLARAENDDVHLTNTGAVVGTPAYMSPEQGRGEKVDHRTDLFSLGVLLYRLCTEKLPFRGANTMAILTSLAVDTPAPVRQLNPAVPEALEAIIDRLLAKNPDGRVQTAMEVVVALRDIEQPKSVSGPLPVVVPLQPLPMAITAQTQNVWEGIDDSESVPVPPAASAETEADPAPAPKPARKQPERKASKLPLFVAGAALLAAVAVLVAVMGPKKTNQPVVQNNEPPEKPAPPDKKQPPVAAPDPDRRAAEYVLSIGGTVRVNSDGQNIDIGTAGNLPQEPFTLTVVDLRYNKKVTDSGLAHFKDCKQLTGLTLNDTQVSDAGLANFKDCENLTILNLYSTGIGDAGLAYFKNSKGLTNLFLGGGRISDAGLEHLKDCCKNLTQLRLACPVSNAALAIFKDSKKLEHVMLNTPTVGNAALAHFKDSKQLTHLDVRTTKITLPAIEAFNKALPQCAIVHDGGTIPGKDIEREVTTELLGRAGSAVLILPDGREVWAKKPAEIPPGPFAIDVINIRTPFSEADLKRLEPLRRLRVINLLRGHTISAEGLRSVLAHKSTLDWLRLDYAPVSDESLKVVGQLPELSLLGLNDTKVTNDGLKHLTGLKKLRQLELENAPVTDAAIDTLAEMKSLVLLNVTGTKLTEPGLKTLAEKLPRCKITHDKGVLEPTVSADPDRKAAEYVVSIGGIVRVSGEGKEIKMKEDLPKERFLLTEADLRYNKNVTDAGLANFKDCKNLTHLNLWDTQATDAGMTYFKDCKNLTILHLRGTKVGDVGLVNFKDCKNLTYLNLQATQLTDAGLAYFKDCKNLTYLALSGSKVTDAGLAHFQNCKDLTTLYLDDTGVTDAGLANFKDCKNLWHLGVARTQVTDAGLIHFKDCKNLKALNLQVTQVTDAGLAPFKDCKELAHLTVQKTMVTAPEIAEFAKAQPQCKIEWDGPTIEPTKK